MENIYQYDVYGKCYKDNILYHIKYIDSQPKELKQEYVAVYSDSDEAYTFDDLESCENQCRDDLIKHCEIGTIVNIYNLTTCKLIKTLKKDIIEIKQLKDL
jgi:hypothetical protein